MTNVVKRSDLKEEPVTEDGDEVRFNCPFCLGIRGKADNEAKLYYNSRKRKGHCWKCGTVVIGDQDWSLETAKSKLSCKRIPEKQSYNLSDWSYPVTKNSQSFDYLTSRGLSSSTIEYFQFRESDHFEGVIIPNPVKDKDQQPYLTDFCQVRYFHSPVFRYLGIPESKKPVYGSNLVQPNSEICICEGVFSSISAQVKLELPSVALYGKSLTSAQLEIIKKMNPTIINLILDGKELRDIIEIGRKLGSLFKTYAIFLPFGKDPEEDSDLETTFRSFRLEMNSINVSKLNDIRYKYANVEQKWDLARYLSKRKLYD